ncbi:MAG: DUF615 domain-containing protein [Desulfovibrio sp.]|nr:DUF615 domain-containing protein [Desulfovibrio sp.]
MPKPKPARRPQFAGRKQENGEEGQQPSRSARKRESVALQKLGEELTGLTPAERGALNLPEELTAALTDLDNIRDREAQRRQRQYIGKLMRSVDAGAIATALAAARNARPQRSEWLVVAKNYTEMLLNAPERDLNKVLKRFLAFTIPGMLGTPQPDTLRRLRELARRARGQRQTSPSETASASRELFDALAALLPS